MKFLPVKVLIVLPNGKKFILLPKGSCEIETLELLEQGERGISEFYNIAECFANDLNRYQDFIKWQRRNLTPEEFEEFEAEKFMQVYHFEPWTLRIPRLIGSA